MKYDCFLCHAKEDRQFTEDLYLALRRAGFNPWMDKPPAPYEHFGIPFGSNWDDAIRTAIKGSALFLAILSSVSVGKRGYVQREYKLALDVMAEMPPEEIFLLPVLIDECKLPQIRIDGVKFDAYQAMELHNRDISKVIRYFNANRKSLPSGLHMEVRSEEFAHFVNSILPNTSINIVNDMEISNISAYQGRYFDVVDQFDGNQLELRGLNNFSIKGQDNKAHLFIRAHYPNVLTFRGCSKVTLSNLKIGHYPEEGHCTGGVLEFSDCEDVVIDNCDLYGCGIFGLKFTRCENVLVENSIIRDCTYGIMGVFESKGLVFNKVTASKNREYYGFEIKNSNEVKFNKCDILMNDFSGYLFEVFRSDVLFSESRIVDNKFLKFSRFDNSVKFDGCIVSNDVGMN